MIGSSTEKRQRACGHTQVLRGAISPQRDSVFSGIGCILFPSPCLINMLPCYPETCGQTSFEVSCTQQLLSPYTSLEAPARGLSVYPCLSRLQHSQESQERPEGRLCLPAPHTSSPSLGWSQHTPALHTTGCLCSVSPHHLLPCRGRKRPQLHKHYTPTFCHSFQSPVLLSQSSFLSAQPWASCNPLARWRFIESDDPWLPQPDTKLLVTITRSALPLLCEQRAVSIACERVLQDCRFHV